MLVSTQLWPIASLASLPTCFSVTSMVVQLASNFISFLTLYCMRSLPVISALQLSAADAGAANRKAFAPMRAAASSVCLSFIVSLSVSGVRSVGDAEPLVHDRARRRVLKELFLLRIQMVLDREGRQRRLVEAAENQLLLAGVRVDVAHGINAGDIGLEFLGVDLERFLLELEAPFCDRPELRVQPEEHEQVIAVERHERAVETLHRDATERAVVDVQRVRNTFDVAHAPRFGELAHLQHGGRRAAEVRPAMHEREARSFRSELHRPVERRIATAEHHEPLAVKQVRVAHAIADVIALERCPRPATRCAAAGTNPHRPR